MFIHKSDKSQFEVCYQGGTCNETIYIVNIYWCAADSGREAIRKRGTIIRTEIRARLGQSIPVCRHRSTGAPTQVGQVIGHCVVTGCDRFMS